MELTTSCCHCGEEDVSLNNYGHCEECAWVYVDVPHEVGGTILSAILSHPDRELAETCTRPPTNLYYILTEWHIPRTGLRCETWDDIVPPRNRYQLRVARGYHEKCAAEDNE